MNKIVIDGREISIDEQLRDLDRSDCEDDLYTFLKYAWKYIDSSEFTDGWPIQAVADHLQAVADGDIKRLIINIPPRCAKSSLTSVAFPAWVWAQPWKGYTSGPGIQFLHASYAQQLSLRDSVKCRRLIESPWYQSLWGDRFHLTGDQNTKTRFDNNQGGSRLSTSVGSALTGEGGNCFVAGTMVSTPKGSVPIEKISVGDKVFAFDHLRGKVVTSDVIATKPRASDDIFEVRTTQGHSFQCTGDHPVFIAGRGYIPASAMGPGDRVIVQGWSQDHHRNIMLKLRDWSRKKSVRAEEGASSEERGRILFEGMLLNPSFVQKLTQLRGLWQSISGSAQKVLLKCLQGDNSPKEDCGKKTRQILSDLLKCGAESLIHVLQPLVRQQGTYGSHDRFAQLSLYGVGSLLKSVSSDCRAGSGTGWSQMFGLFAPGFLDQTLQNAEKVNFAGSSHRSEHEEQRSGEPDCSVHEMSQVASSWEIGTVKSVSRIGGKPVPVYDIQVERFSNFFAEGVLAHNCIIVDDPNAAQEAFSEATIQSTIEWWDSALSTRLNDPKNGAFVVIQQRLSEEDLTGHILSKDVGEWTHLCLPMRYEWRRHSYSSLGWHDPRGLDADGEPLIEVNEDGERIPISVDAELELEKREGALLWPERFGEREVSILERQLGPWSAAGQLQQRPEPKGGGIIKSDWWQPWDASSYPNMDMIIACVDTAYTTKTENDPSAMTVWGVFSQGVTVQSPNHAGDRNGGGMSYSRSYTETNPRVMLMYAWQGRYELHDLVNKISETCKKMQVDTVLIENKAAGHSVAQEIKRMYGFERFNLQLFDPKSQDKLARLYSVQHLFAEGLVYAPNQSWADMVIQQVGQFPKGKHDDLVDTVSMAMRHLRDTGVILRSSEWQAEFDDALEFKGNQNDVPLYPA